MKWTAGIIASSLLADTASANPSKRGWYPTVKSSQIIGPVADPSLNRDSCGCCRIGNRAFWTCRDTQPFDSKHNPTLPVWSSSSSWTNFNFDGTPGRQQYGGDYNNKNPYFYYTANECNGNSAGGCPDGTRYAIWPDSPPVVTSTNGNIVTAYTWIKKTHIKGDFSTNDPDPATSLYKVTHDTSTQNQNQLPRVTLVNEDFWLYGAIPYGAYGNVAKDGMLYLYGRPSNGVTALARVPTNAVEDRSKYEFWVNNGWRKNMPGKSDSGINIPNSSAGGQGTYYFSDFWKKYVWIGQPGISVAADFQVTTADSPTGPWEQPVHFYSGQNGNYSLSAYSLQANPALSISGTSKNEIYITYTKNDVVNNINVYTTPLIKIVWN